MMVTIYGLLGHAGKLVLPLEHLDVEELAPGQEFVFEQSLYQIRSVLQQAETVLLNVTMVMQAARA